MTRLRRAGLILALFGLLPILAPVPVKGATTASNLIVIKALSNRADLISGGDALVEIVLPGAVSAAGLVVTVNGRDISSGFAPRPALGGRIVGLVTGIVVRPNQPLPRDSGPGLRSRAGTTSASSTTARPVACSTARVRRRTSSTTRPCHAAFRSCRPRSTTTATTAT